MLYFKIAHSIILTVKVLEVISDKSVAKIVSKINKKKFHSYEINEENHSWFPILEVPDEGNFLGVNDLGEWVCGKEEWVKNLQTQKNSFILLPILKMKKQEFVSNLKKAITTNDLPEVIIDTFPFDHIVIGGLQSYGDNFKNAVSWLDDGFPPNDVIASICDEKCPNKISAINRWRNERLKSILSI